MMAKAISWSKSNEDIINIGPLAAVLQQPKLLCRNALAIKKRAEQRTPIADLGTFNML